MKLFKKVAIGTLVFIVVVVLAGIVYIKTLDFNTYRGLISDQVKRATGRDLTIGGDLAINVSLTPLIAVDDVRFSNASWGTRPDMVKVKRLAARVELLPLFRKEVRIIKILIDEPDIWVETDAKGQGNWQFKTATEEKEETIEAPEAGSIPLPVIQEVAITNVRLHYRNGKTGQEQLLTLDRLSAHAAKLSSPLQVRLTARYQKIPLQLDGELGSARALINNEPYAISLKGKLGRDNIFQMNGSIRSPKEAKGVDMAVGIKGDDVAKLFALIHTEMPSNPYDISARFKGDQGVYVMDQVRIKLGSTNLRGRCSLDISKKRPMITAAMKSGFFNTKVLLPEVDTQNLQTKSATKKSKGGKKEKLFSPEPLPLDVLKKADAQVSLSVDTLQHNTLSLKETSVKLNLRNGRLQMKPLETRFDKGTVRADLDLDANREQPKLTLNLDSHGVQLGKIFKDLTGSDLVQGGPTVVKVTLNSHGKSIRNLMAKLSGRLLVKVGPGRINNKEIDLVGADLLAVLLSSLNPFSKEQDYSELKCAVINFPITKGIARKKLGIGIETAEMNVSGGGTINLGTEQIDLSIRPMARKGIGISAGVLASLVRLQGPLNAPKPTMDAAGMAKTAASIGLALTTGGTSLLGQALLDRATADPSPCQTALGGN